jgi:DDE family transposase
MAGNGLPKEARRRLYGFARKVASPLTDSRRARFVQDMIAGLVIGGHVHLSKVARAISPGDANIHAVEKRLSRHLGSEHWYMSPIGDHLLAWSAAAVHDDTIITADLTDMSKPYAHVLQGLGKVHDGSKPDKPIVSGYAVFESYVRVGGWQMFPLIIEPLKAYTGAPISENMEILRHMLRIHQATVGKGTWTLDRGFDRDELMLPFLKNALAFVVRQRGDRHVRQANGDLQAVREIAESYRPVIWPRRWWRRRGFTARQSVWLPEAPDQELWLVMHWRKPNSEPLMLLVSPTARRPGRRAEWFVKAYRRRWGVEDATWGIKQRFHLEAFLVRSWIAICRLLVLIALAFYWLNLWGHDRFAGLRQALINHPWRLPKEVTYLFDWIALQLGQLLHPRPTFRLVPASNTG